MKKTKFEIRFGDEKDTYIHYAGSARNALILALADRINEGKSRDETATIINVESGDKFLGTFSCVLTHF